MASFSVLCLAICLLLGQQSLAKNDAPCQPARWNNAYNTFIKRHVPSGAPNSLDRNEWDRFIRRIGSCERPTQSFLDPRDLQKVKAVCTSGGGKVYTNNLCISKQPFTFITVRYEICTRTCRITDIRRETKHLILACDRIGNQCLPVHFEGNPYNMMPNNNARDCQ